MSEQSAVCSVEVLDLERYLGLWYEIGRLPLRFEDDEASDVTAEYRLESDGRVTVNNRCRDAKGEPVQALGQAVPDDEHPGRLKVSFLPAGLRWIPFTQADYWVLRIDPGYRTALVGTPDHKYLWLLSREPQLDRETEQAFLETASQQDFDLSEWISTPQTGNRVTEGQLD